MVRTTPTKRYDSEARLLISRMLELRTPSQFLGQSHVDQHFHSFLQRHLAYSTIPLRQRLHIVHMILAFLSLVVRE